MKKIISLLLSFTLVFSALGGTLQSYAAENDYEYITVKAKFNQTEARKMLGYVNSFRTGDEAWFWRNYKKVYAKNAFGDKEHVGTKLVYDYRLEQYAMQRAIELYFNLEEHIRPNGTYCLEVVEEENRNNGKSFCVENIVEVPASYKYGAKDIFNIFKQDVSKPIAGGLASQGNRINMLSPYTTFACAYCEYDGMAYWVQAFGYIPFDDAFEKTDPVDTTKKMTIELLCEMGYSFRRKDEDISKISIYEKDSIAVPSVYSNKHYGYLYNKRKKLEVKLTTNNNNAVIKNGKIVGKTAGTTVFTASGGDLPEGRTVELKVTVKHKYKLIKHIKATSKKEGKKVYKCECCGHKKTVKLPKLPPVPKNIKVKGGKGCFILTWDNRLADHISG